MDTVRIKDAEIPKIGLGTYKLVGREGQKSIEQALDAGYRHIDTAQFYDNEDVVGMAVKNRGIPRHEVFITTKVWHDRLNRARLAPSVDASLKKLQTDVIDLLLIHWPSKTVPLAETLEEMGKLVEQQKVRFVGVSNFTVPLLKEALTLFPDLVTNQVEYHPFLKQDHLLSVIEDNDMSLMAYRPIALGEVLNNKTLQKIAETHNKTPAQIALRWLYQQPRVIPIPKSSHPARIEENIDILDFELSQEDMKAISKLGSQQGRQISPDFAPDWDAAA